MQIIRRIDDAADVLERHVGTAGMEVGDDRDGELAAARPAWRRQRVRCDDEAERLDCAGIGAGRGRRQAGDTGARGKEAAPRQAAAYRAPGAGRFDRVCSGSISIRPFIAPSVVNGVVHITADQARLCGHDCARRSRVTQSSVLSSARVSRSNNSSISSALMMSGGDSVSTSPSTARTIKPSASANCTARAPTPCCGANERLRVFVGDEFDAADQAEPARFADQRMFAERCSRAWNCAPRCGGLFDDAVARIDLDRLQRDRGRRPDGRHR